MHSYSTGTRPAQASQRPAWAGFLSVIRLSSRRPTAYLQVQPIWPRIFQQANLGILFTFHFANSFKLALAR